MLCVCVCTLYTVLIDLLCIYVGEMGNTHGKETVCAVCTRPSGTYSFVCSETFHIIHFLHMCVHIYATSTVVPPPKKKHQPSRIEEQGNPPNQCIYIRNIARTPS